MKSKKEFKRKEHKYLIPEDLYETFMSDLQHYMSVDKYGLHTIMSLYYDTDDFQLIKHSMEKPDYKEKLRVRCYQTPNDSFPVFLELKKKIRGTVYKSRIELPYKDYLNLESPDELSKEITTSQTYKEINWVRKRYKNLKPRVLISYDRLSLFEPNDPNFRVTFDHNIRFRTHDLSLKNGSYGKIIAPEIGVLMEVKVLGAYPLWFVDLLNKYGLRKASFSKYSQTYTRYIHKPVAEVMTHVS
ncbi:molecular chaperone [Vagococcus martis]|uniref:Molecular chaperone n=1 Tax=Vagococcus martis TaxID=1768210 RepID=A0A1V4DI78_9ENTE|nr:polyphosphate polymerase domain-containing protein [Vagococcus martis]OPF88141.1 molecular chaperone [Vagococcus martis]